MNIVIDEDNGSNRLLLHDNPHAKNNSFEDISFKNQIPSVVARL